MNRMKRKIRSQTGASLTFALLLFLVCAVVGSVVLTAGTAAAGRMSKISEMDQRYYSVNSAAKLLIDLFQKDEICCEKKEEVTSDGDDPEGESEADVSASDYMFTINGEDVSSKNTMVMDAINQIIEMPRDKASEEQTLNLEISGLEIEKTNLNVEIKETIHKNGDLDFVIRNKITAEEKNNGQYVISLYFNNIGQSGSEQFKTYRWKLTDIETVSKLPSD